MSDKPPKKGKGKKLVLLIVLPLLLVGGGVVGAAKFGILKIPGLTPAQKGKMASNAAALYGDQPTAKPKVTQKTKPSKPKEPVRISPEPPKPDLEAGAKRLAKVWNELDVETLNGIVKNWKDDDLARVLSQMDIAKVAALLSKLDANRASRLSEAMQLQAAISGKPKT